MLANAIEGNPLRNGDKLTEKYSKIGIKLMQKKLNLYNKPLPKYMVDIFNHIFYTTPRV